MGSSVDFYGAFGLWNTFCVQNGHTNHIPRKFWISWGYFSDIVYLIAGICLMKALFDLRKCLPTGEKTI